MSFKDLDIKDSYRSDEYKDLGEQFISKVLEHSLIYKRAVGFFSSSSLIKISKGISYLTRNPDAHIHLVVSPILYEDDVKAIIKGYKNRKSVIENALMRELKDVHLIEDDILDIKVADTMNEHDQDDYGMFHEKIGLFYDNEGNSIAFTGSLNESDNAYSKNFESIQVFKSWEEQKRVSIIENDFEKLWLNKTNSLDVYDFPEAVKKELFKYKKNVFHKDIDDYIKREKQKKALKNTLPSYNCKFDLYQYQKDAINRWAKQNFKGLFNMGTGTGKTITALTASVKLLERLEYKMATIIVCPYTHLVEQWVQEENNFNIDFIVGYSSPKYKNYLTKLRQTIQDFNDGVTPYFYFITTNASYKLDKIQDVLKEIRGNTLFIADECHNFGSEGLRKNLNENFQYRIGLSATIDRHRDEEGTDAIYKYFGNTCINYGLKEAISNEVLTRYYYYPIVVSLNEEEQDKYIDLTNSISKCTYRVGDKVKLTKQGEMYALERARIIAAANNKLTKLKEVIQEYVNDYNMLIYCGTGKIKEENGTEEKQIDEVCSILGNELGMKIARYTSRETTEERRIIAERYKNGNDLQALVAIKCLDEGVNIPSIKTAFILASSTNPREYIQRRGRVLRKFKGKKYSYIYDFVTLPFELEDVYRYDSAYIDKFKTLAKNEIERIKEFSSLSENEHDSDILINEMNEVFELDKFEKVDDFEKIIWEDLDD